jgi:site-specific recombinase XerD
MKKDYIFFEERLTRMLLTEARTKFLAYLQSIDRSADTVDGYGKDIKYFTAFVEKKYNRPCYITDVSENDIEEYLIHRKEKGIASSSRSRNLNTLRSFYNWAVKKHHTVRNPAQGVDSVKVKKSERIFLTAEEVDELLGAIPQKIVYAVVKTLYYTGLRISECLGLTFNNVDLDNRKIYVINGKGGKDRIIPISDKLHEHMTGYLETTRPKVRSDFFFATERSGTVSEAYVNEVIGAATTRLGWSKHVTCHILRHSFASNLVKAGINLGELQKLLGHSSLAVTSVYTHTSIEDLHKSVNLI